MELKVNPAFRDLIPPLSADEFRGLEENIIKDGCIDALLVWNDTIIDGHNRYDICTKNGIEFETHNLDFVDESEAKIWIIQNQFGRRNISNATRAMLALELEPLIAEKANQRMLAGKPIDPGSKSTQGRTRTKIADIAGIGETTIYEAKKVKESDNEEVKQKMLAGEISIHKAYTEVVPQKTYKAFQPQYKVCTICGQQKRAEEFSPGRSVCRECRNERDNRMKEINKVDTDAIIERMSKKEPSEDGDGYGSDNRIIAEYLEIIKDFRRSFNKYLYMPSQFSGTGVECMVLTETIKAKDDLETIINFIKGEPQ